MPKITTAAVSSLVLCLVLVGGTAVAADAEPRDKRQAMREAIDSMAQQTLVELVERSPKAREAYHNCAGWAVFDSFKVALLISGGGGVGVAVDRSNGATTYMKSGSGGIGLGLGGQSYQTVFFFETTSALRRFVDKGWQANTSAHAVAGTAGKNAGSTFSDSVAVFQVTHKGLMVNIDVSGTKYWKHRKLNRSGLSDAGDGEPVARAGSDGGR